MIKGSVNRISVLGCGWLGLPLAKRLLLEGFRVKGSTTEALKRNELDNLGIEAYQILLDRGKEITDDDFFESDVLIINFPPRRVEGIEEIYPAQVDRAMERAMINGVSRMLFVSSTSVYPNLNREYTEDDVMTPDKASGRALLKAEESVHSYSCIKSTVLRLGGLIGPNRNPIHSINRKKLSIPPNTPVNLIHLDDCIEIILKLIKNDNWGECYNACAPEHPSRKEFYSDAARRLGVEIPSFSETGDQPWKIIDSGKLLRDLAYSFKYPDPLKMY